MGNICKKTSFIGFNDNYQKITINNFECVKKDVGGGKKEDEIIGQGGFGVVKRVKKKNDPNPNETYAMKMMEKYQVSKKNNIQTTLNEMFILRDIQHPFLINMKWAFHDETYLYLVMEELKGNDLHFHLVNFKLRDDLLLKQRHMELEQKKTTLERLRKKQPDISKGTENKKQDFEISCFTENQARFIIAQLCLALNYLHNNKIIHKDIKPANIIFEEDGYLRVTDLGISKKFRPNNNVDMSGTPGYIAPEVLCRQNHNYAVDYYAVGVITYELMLAKKPYESDKPEKENINKEYHKNILQSQIEVVPMKQSTQKPGQSELQNGVTRVVAPQEWSNDGIDFINQCLQRQPTKRIGYDNLEKVLEHSWFKGIDFDRLAAKKYKNIPFNKFHIERSFQRSKLNKFLQDEILQYEELIEKEKQKQIDNQNDTSSSSDDDEKEEREAKNLKLNKFQQQKLQQQKLQQNMFNIQNQFNQEQQKRLQEQQLLDEQEKMNQKKLQNIQHFFKQYYFDRERYDIEVRYLEQERRKLEQGKKSKSNSNLQDFQSNSPKRSQVLYGKQGIYENTFGDMEEEDFPDIVYEKRNLDMSYTQFQNQQSMNQNIFNQRQSIIQLQQVNNQNVSFTTQPDTQVSSRRLNESMSQKSDVSNTSFLSRQKNNQEQRSPEVPNTILASKSPQIDPKTLQISTNNSQLNKNQNIQQSRHIFKNNISSVEERNQQF